MSNFVFDKENPEFLAVLEAVALEKGLKKDVINKAVESALETALMEYFTGLYDVSVKIRSNGAVSAFKKVKVVENVSDIYREISLDEAKVFDKDSTLGAEILMPLSVSGFSSHIIRNIGFLINKEMIKREKEAEFNYFQKLKGFIISGVVKKVYFGGLLIVMDKYEAFLAKNLETISALTITISGKANEKGHLFAGIHKDEIVEAVKKQANVTIHPDFLILDKPLKETGNYEVLVQAGGKKANLKLSIEGIK